MIIAGIDEAGLGPKLGPLVVSATGFWLDDIVFDLEKTSLWEVFSHFTSANHKRGDTRLLIADSKIAYKARGIEGLKNSVLTFCKALNPELSIKTLQDLLNVLGAAELIPEMAKSKWYTDILSRESADPRLRTTDKTHKVISTPEARPLLLRTKILTARMFNNQLNKGFNKSEVLLSQTGSHIKHIINSFPDETIRIIVDKQGGKTYYAPYLIDLLDGAWVDIVREGAASSLYKIGNKIQIEFLPKADKNNFTVALASLVSKFLRETLMAEFNNYFTTRSPELQPTAGYPQDAIRFLGEIPDILKCEEISMHCLWRER